MPLLKVRALVLRNLRLGETSRVVTVLSRELGKWGAVAKGVRNPKSRFGASLEILNISSLVVYFRPGRDLQMIAEGSLDREYRGLFRQGERYHHGCAVLEFLDRVLENEASVPEIYDLAERVLDLMEEAPLARVAYLFRAFQLRTAGWLGYAPRLDACVSCGSREVEAFAPAAGGVLCRSCEEQTPGTLPMGERTLALLRSLRRGSLPRAPVREAVLRLDSIAEAFLSFHIDRYRGLRSLRVLNDLERPRAPQGSPSPATELPADRSPR